MKKIGYYGLVLLVSSALLSGGCGKEPAKKGGGEKADITFRSSEAQLYYLGWEKNGTEPEIHFFELELIDNRAQTVLLEFEMSDATNGETYGLTGAYVLGDAEDKLKKCTLLLKGGESEVLAGGDMEIGTVGRTPYIDALFETADGETVSVTHRGSIPYIDISLYPDVSATGMVTFKGESYPLRYALQKTDYIYYAGNNKFIYNKSLDFYGNNLLSGALYETESHNNPMSNGGDVWNFYVAVPGMDTWYFDCTGLEISRPDWRYEFVINGRSGDAAKEPVSVRFTGMVPHSPVEGTITLTYGGLSEESLIACISTTDYRDFDFSYSDSDMIAVGSISLIVNYSDFADISGTYSLGTGDGMFTGTMSGYMYSLDGGNSFRTLTLDTGNLEIEHIRGRIFRFDLSAGTAEGVTISAQAEGVVDWRGF